MRTFAHLLVNTLLVTVINFTVWFAITFYVYLQTRSVFATGTISGIFLVATAGTGIWFGSLVDRFPKKAVMQVSAAVSLTAYAACLALYLLTPKQEFTDVTSVRLWVFVVLLMFGVIAGNIRSIALMTLVTALIAEDRRDRANGLVGTTSGVSILVTSVISGLLVGRDGMFSVLVLALVVLGLALLHLGLIPVPTPPPAPREEGTTNIDIRGTLRVVGSVPGLSALIVFSCLNNFLGGAFMALLDPYGLSMMSVQAWGILWGFISLALIAGGLTVARFGLGRNPLRVVLLGNLANWTACSLFALQSSIVMLTIGMVVWLSLMPVIEAAEQTVLQRSIPFERQGRVFGFAQLVENGASPLTAFLIAPIAETVFMPFMTDGRGADVIGGWFGTGPERGIALMFTLAGLFGVVVTVLVRATRSYRRLADGWSAAPA